VGRLFRPRLGRFAPGKDTRYVKYRMLDGSQEWTERMPKTPLTLEFEPRTVQPVTSQYIDRPNPNDDCKKRSKSNIIHSYPLLASRDRVLVKIFYQTFSVYCRPTSLRVFFELASIARNLRVDLQTVRGLNNI
jgi:hypothetical protein